MQIYKTDLDIIIISLKVTCSHHDKLLLISIFFKFTSTSLFTSDTFLLKLKNVHEYHIQHSLKSGGTEDHFRWIKVPGTVFTLTHLPGQVKLDSDK